MSFVKRFLGRAKPSQYNDRVFGPMHYMGDNVGYWEAKVAFAPTQSTIELFVDGSADGDMELQRKFFHQLVTEWSGISEVIGKLLLRSWREREPETRGESPWDLFTLSSVSIPMDSIEAANWEISFTAVAAPDQLWTIRMEGREPRQITVDD